MDIRQFLDSTYLKTAQQAQVSESENMAVNKRVIAEAIAENFKCVMVRPEIVPIAKDMATSEASRVSIGTVIDFPEGNSGIEVKLHQACKAIADGADDLDFVCDYRAFINGDSEKVKQEIFEATQLCLSSHKTVKWIIESAALDPQQIIRLSSLIKNVVLTNFKEESYANIFVKSSTGYFNASPGKSNGATIESIILMLENASPLQVKASGGIRSTEEALNMITLGVRRVGTSSAKAIADGQTQLSGH